MVKKKKKIFVIIGILLIIGLFFVGFLIKEKSTKQDIIKSIENDDSLSNLEKEFAKNMVENVDSDKIDSKKIEKLSTKEYDLGDIIVFSGIELKFTTLEKAMHSKFTDFEKDVEHYRLTYEIKNLNSERIVPCNFEFVLLDDNGHQVSDSFGVMDDGFDGDEIYSNVKIVDRQWFETNNDISGNITIYIKPFFCDEACQTMRELMGFDDSDDEQVCPKFEIKLDVSEDQVLVLDEFEYLN